MIDQIWYTWSASGLGGKARGYRVRAASPKLRDLQTDRYRSLDRHLRYSLPEGIDPYSMTPENAPVCLSLIDIGSERLLVRKVFKGRDAFGRPGVYFSHMLAGLPEDFIARDAIRLWNSPLLQSSDASLAPNQTELEELSEEDLYDANKGARAPVRFTDIREQLHFIIAAYLTRIDKMSAQPICIVGDSALVAGLLWGLTHSLPCTLQKDLTFSTYEKDAAESMAVVVGTTMSQELAQSYARPGAFMLYCDLPPRSSFVGKPEIEKFATFAVNCLIDDYGRLSTFLKAAENAKQPISTSEQFTDFFARYMHAIAAAPPSPLPPVQVTPVPQAALAGVAAPVLTSGNASSNGEDTVPGNLLPWRISRSRQAILALLNGKRFVVASIIALLLILGLSSILLVNQASLAATHQKLEIAQAVKTGLDAQQQQLLNAARNGVPHDTKNVDVCTSKRMLESLLTATIAIDKQSSAAGQAQILLKQIQGSDLVFVTKQGDKQSSITRSCNISKEKLTEQNPSLKVQLANNEDLKEGTKVVITAQQNQ